MRFQIPQEIESRKMEFREFLETEIRQIGDERDASGPLKRDELSELILKLQPTDIMRASLPEEVGGTNRTFLERVVLAEEFARVWPSLAVTVDSHNIVVELIARQGSDWMKEAYVEKGMRGEIITGELMSEPQAGSDTRNIKATAILDGDAYVVNGTKMWTTNGFWAEVGLLTALSDPSAFARNPQKGVVHLLVDRSVSPFKSRDLPIIGLKAGTTGFMEFNNCRVPKKYLFHDESMGYMQNLVVRGWARVLLAAWACGIMQAVLEDATEFAKERITFGKRIGSHQMIQDMIAEMLIGIETSRLATYKAAELMDHNIRCDLEQALAKAYACEVVNRVAGMAIQILGARGLTTNEGFRTERFYRDARFLSIAEGTTQIMKLIIGRKTLGMSAIS
ncbi:MAG: acyl-CoA/acyl-ACP dehydrogenase [Deltaproteobacteria bacterium]|nr:acyl-CoA/acyl-ACP dehydrogenase [Deltaproteobacteria bacterium]